jgi:MFS family permease
LRWRCSLLLFLYYATQGALVPLFPLRLQELHFTPLEMGCACATQALAALAAPLLAGQVADRWISADRCLAAYALLAGLLLWVLAELDHPWAVFLASLGVWLVLSPTSTLCVALSFAHLQSARDFGPIRLWGTVGWVASGWLLGYGLSNPAWLTTGLGWLRPGTPQFGLADAIRFSGLMAFALAAYALTLPPTPPLRRGAWLAPLAALRLLRDRNFAVYWGCLLGVCVTLPFTIQLIPLLLDQLGVPRAWMGPTLTLGQSIEIISLALLPVLLERFGIRGTMLVGVAGWTLLLAVLTLGEPLWLVIVSLTLNGLCIAGFIVAGQIFVSGRAHEDVRASAQALLTWVYGLGMLTGHLLVGWVRQQAAGQFRATFSVSLAIGLILTVGFYVGFRPDEKNLSA